MLSIFFIQTSNAQCTIFTKVGDGAPIPISDLSQVPGYIPNQGSYCLEVYGDLTVSSGYIFTNSVFKMHAGSKLFITPFAYPQQITFSNCILSGVDKMWEGIFISNPINNGYMIDFNFINSTLKDAVYGLNILSDLTLSVKSSNFYNNYISIYSSKAGSPRNILCRNFVGNNFGSMLDPQGLGTMLPKYYGGQPYENDRRSSNAIYMDNIHYFQVGYYDGVGTFPNNKFRNLHSGIYANRTSLDVKNSEFANIFDNSPYVNTSGSNAIFSTGISGLTTLKVKGLGINTPFCTNVFNGVHFIDLSDVNISDCDFLTNSFGITGFSQNAPSTTFSITNNVVHNSRSGIGLFELYKLNGNWDLSNNYIDFSSYGGPDDTGIHYGIQFENFSPSLSFGASIKNNSILLNRPFTAPTNLISTQYLNNSLIENNAISSTATWPNVPNEWIGININNCGAAKVDANTINGSSNWGNTPASIGILSTLSPAMDMLCNSTNNTNEGIYIEGDCSLSHIVQNEINHHRIGLHYIVGSSTAPVQNNTGNQWLSQSNQNSARNEETEPDILFQTSYWVHSNAMPLLPTPRLPLNGWFLNQGSIQPGVVCQNLGDGQFIPDGGETEYNDYFKMLIDGTYPEVSFMDGRLFWARWNLLNVQSLRPELLVDYTDIVSWANSQSTTNIGVLQNCYNQLGTLGLSENNQSERNQILLDQESIITGIRSIFAVYDTASPSQQLLYDQQIDQLLAEQDSFHNSGVALLDTIAQLKNTERLNFVSVLQQMTSASVQETNLKNALLCFLQKDAQYIPLDSTDINTLTNIASQCYLDGGPGVIFSRSILKKHNIVNTFNDDSLCLFNPAPIINLTTDEIANQQCLLYPNPSTNEINIELVKDNIIAIEIRDVQGTLNRKLQCESNKIQLVTNKISKGVHFIRIYTSNGEVINKKFIKL